MKKIFLYGAEAEAAVLPLCRALSGYGGVLYLGGGHVCDYGDTRVRFTVVVPGQIESFAAEDSVMWLSSPLPDSELNGFCVERAFAVVEQSDTAALHTAVRAGFTAITYGASRGDFSLSSFDGETANMCLSRAIVTNGSKIIPPCEIPVRTLGCVNTQQLPAIAAVLVLCGCGEVLNI